jgi:hypothetical protein
VKIVMHGPISARDHLGQMVGFGPDQEVEVDDGDAVAVAWARGWAATDFATLAEDAKTKTQEPEPPAKEPAKPEPPRQPTPRAETRTETPTGRQRK